MVGATSAQATGEPGESALAVGGAGVSAAGGLPAAAASGAAAAGGDGREEGGGVGAAAAAAAAAVEKRKLFPIRNMNVMNPLDSSDNQIDDTVNRRRAARMHSLLQVYTLFECGASVYGSGLVSVSVLVLSGSVRFGLCGWWLLAAFVSRLEFFALACVGPFCCSAACRCRCCC